MNWKALIHGILSAVAGGAATAVAQAYDKGDVTIPELKTTAITGAVLGLAMYFVKPATQQPPPKPQQADPPPDPGPQG